MFDFDSRHGDIVQQVGLFFLEYFFQRVRLEIPEALGPFHMAGDKLIIEQGCLNLPRRSKLRLNVHYDTTFLFFNFYHTGSERFPQIELPARFQISHEGKDDFSHESSFHPITVMMEANLRGGIRSWDFPPRSTGGQSPEDTVEDLALVNGRTAALTNLRGCPRKGRSPLFDGGWPQTRVCGLAQCSPERTGIFDLMLPAPQKQRDLRFATARRKKRLDQLPLFVGEIHFINYLQIERKKRGTNPFQGEKWLDFSLSGRFCKNNHPGAQRTAREKGL
jgi:hypothetical protein